MNNSTYRFTLDLRKHQSQMAINVFRYDTAVRLCISFTDGGKPYGISDGCIARLFGTRADGAELIHNCMIKDNTEVIYDFEETTACVEGITDCQIRLFGTDGRLISAPRFIIVVDERVGARTNDDIDINVVTPIIDQLLLAESQREAAENTRVTAENARAEAETERVNAEQARAEAETKRLGIFVGYSASSDGTGFTDTWSSGQDYIGVALAKERPTNKGAYTWSLFKGEQGSIGLTPTFQITEDGELQYSYTSITPKVWTPIGNIKGGKGNDGTSITGAEVNDSGELVLTLSDGNTINAGKVKGEDGSGGECKLTDAEAAYLSKLYTDSQYVAFTGSLSMSPTTTEYEIGASNTVAFSWSFSKTPTSLTFNNVAQPLAKAGSTSLTVTSSTQKTLTYALKAQCYDADYNKTESVNLSKSISFYNKYYWGCKAMPATIDSDFIKSLSNSGWAKTKEATFTPPRTPGAYIWYAYPKRLGEATMYAGVNKGGFEPPVTVSVKNRYNITEDYLVYRSTNPGVSDEIRAK